MLLFVARVARTHAPPQGLSLAIGEGKIAPSKWGDIMWIAGSLLFANGLAPWLLGEQEFDFDTREATRKSIGDGRYYPYPLHIFVN